MLKIYLKIISLFAFLIAFLSFLPFIDSVNASSVYTVTTGIPNTPVPYTGATFLTKDLNVSYQTGDNIWLSSQTDGTGSTIVDDAIEIIVTRPNGTTARFNHSYPNYCGDLVRYYPPYNLTNLFLPGQNQVRVRLYDICGGRQFSGPIYLVNISLGPTPFLDLPWDYQGKGLSFNEAALAINSYFDHEYPLLSSGLGEPSRVINYQGPPVKDLSYSSHDGYDYGKSAKANLGDPVLTAADGCASYRKTGAGGNIIMIDHGNGYQTRYLHLLDDGLITQSSSCVTVAKGQQIGNVGYTGNVIPAGEQGAHIHFMVIQDKNNDGNFDDNIPDGVTDPFGWQSTQPDPWPNYSFNYGGQNRTGNTSFYLWTKAIANLSSQLTSNGGFFELERYELNFPQGTTNQNLNIQMESAPVAKPSNALESIGSTLVVTAKDALGNVVHAFQNLFTITIDFESFDLTGYDTNTVAIYSSEDGVNWTKEPTVVDLNTKTASAQLNHLSYFALMAEQLDTIAPTTNAVLSGEQGQSNWFRSDVHVTLIAQDNEGGLGVDYTLYKVNGEDWQQYTIPLSFTDEGAYSVEFYSLDNDENIEQLKSTTFNIDKTLPEAKIFIDSNVLDLVVEGVDTNLADIEKTDNPATNKKEDAVYTVSDLAGNVLKLDVRDRDKEGKDRFEIHSLQYNNNSLVTQSDNRFNVDYRAKEEESDVKEQNFEIKGEIKIRIKYDARRNLSIISTREAGQEKQKEIKDGLVLLQLITNQGNLEYGY